MLAAQRINVFFQNSTLVFMRIFSTKSNSHSNIQIYSYLDSMHPNDLKIQFAVFRPLRNFRSHHKGFFKPNIKY